MIDRGTVEGLLCLDSGKMVVEDVTCTSKVGVSTMMKLDSKRNTVNTENN